MSNPAGVGYRTRTMRLPIIAVVVALAALPAGGAGATRADNPVLTGDVGANDGFTISLTGPTGSPARNLDPGTYTLLVHDHSQFHDFHLKGPGVDVTTPVDGTGDFAFTVTLSTGTYTYVCDPHSSQMRGSFTVGTVPTPAPTPTPTPTPGPTKLRGSVGPGRTIGMGTSDGTRFSSLSAGAYTIVVRDRSAADDFHLTGPGVSKATGVRFKGTVTWKLALKAGKYAFKSDTHPALHGAFTVTS